MITPATYNEHELVHALKQDDYAAFGYLYDHYSGALLSVIAPITGDNGLAEDVLQEVLINIFRRVESYEPVKGRLYTWMVNIARNAAIDLIRSKGFRQNSQNRKLDEPLFAEAGSETLKVDQIGLRKIVEKLKPDLKEVLNLAYFSGMTQDEISEELGIPLGTVKTRVRTGLQQLRKWIGNEI